MKKALEEGELEDGELPDELQEPGEADAGEAGEAAAQQRVQEQEIRPERPPVRETARDKDADKSRERPRDERTAGEDREKAELMRELTELTKNLTMMDLMKSSSQVCQDLKAAIKKLDKLFRRVKRRKSDDMEVYPEVDALSRAICNGLRNLCVLSATSHSSRWELEQARQLMRTALNYRHNVMSAASKRDFEANLRQAGAFSDLLEERDRAAGREQQQAQQQGTASNVASPQGQRSPEGAPPPPPPPPDAPQPLSAAPQPVPQGQPLDELQPEPPAATLPVHSTSLQQEQRQGDATASGGKGFKMKIVVTSTTADIRKPSEQQEQQQQQQRRRRPGEAEGGQHAAKRTRLSPSSEFSPPSSPSLAARGGAAAAATNGSLQPKLQRQQQQQHAPSSAAAAGAAPGTGEFSELPEVARLPPGTQQLASSIQSLLRGRRLCLVLDLDHTLVNSARFAEVAPEHAAALEARYEREFALPEHQRELYRVAKLGMWTKLRPGLREFLRRAHQHFELWIHTAGNSLYAEQIMELVDRDKYYFGSRIIAANDEGNSHMVKRLVSGLEGREPIAIIVDDSQAVWPHDLRNLFVVERYIYFPSSKERFGLQGLSLLEIDRDECPVQGMLMTAADVFEEIHTSVFHALQAAATEQQQQQQQQQEQLAPSGSWDVRDILEQRRRQVLAGVVLIFSRVIPLETPPHTHPLWRLAESFGARCSSAVTPDVTHVVAMSRATEKVFQASQQQKFIVSPAWLECCCVLWRRVDEQRFPVPV